MRIAIFSDIHGNSIALDAVLTDIKTKGQIDAYWVLGDLAAIGHDPVGVLERLAALPHAHITRGNADRYIVTGERPAPSIAQATEDNAQIPTLVDVAASFAWTAGCITQAGWLPWLEDLPLETRLTLPDKTRVLGVHAAPGTDDGWGFQPDADDTDYQSKLNGCDADLVICGHTHWPHERYVGDVRVITIGSVGNPCQPDLRASYVILEADAKGHRVQFCRTEYDYQAVIDAVKHARHPSGDYICHFMRGQWWRPWRDNIPLPSLD